MPKTTSGPVAATSTPARAGPTARARLTLRLPSEAAAGICSRGTSSGWIACQPGPVRALPQPMRKTRAMSTEGVVRPAAVRIASAVLTAVIATDRAIRRRRRSSTSARTPAGSDRKSTGSSEAACTREVRVGALGWWTSIHWAPTVCIQVPTLEPSWAIHSERKVGSRRGAHELPPPAGGCAGPSFGTDPAMRTPSGGRSGRPATAGTYRPGPRPDPGHGCRRGPNRAKGRCRPGRDR